MAPLTKCTQCGGPVWVDDVLREVNIAKAPTHVALVWKCSHCGLKSRSVSTIESWKARRSVAGELLHEHAEKVAAIEVGAVQTPGDLVALWDSLPDPPIREAVMGACGCDDCRKRYYG